jgi:hypothetical protein
VNRDKNGELTSSKFDRYPKPHQDWVRHSTFNLLPALIFTAKNETPNDGNDNCDRNEPKGAAKNYLLLEIDTHTPQDHNGEAYNCNSQRIATKVSSQRNLLKPSDTTSRTTATF